MSRLQDWTDEATPIDFIDKESWPIHAEMLPPPIAAFAKACGFDGKAGAHLLAPGPDGAPALVLFGVEAPSARHRDPFLPGKLASLLPAGLYRLRDGVDDPQAAALAFLLSAYSFTRYRERKSEPPRLCAPKEADRARIERIAAAIYLGRDLVNTPANDLCPAALTEAALQLAARHGAQARVIVGDALLAENFPLIHAVGRAAAEPPRLVDITFGPETARKVTLVGKGVCFDSGGLDIKPGSAMLLMKKDMGGAATALALADMLMGARTPLRLRVLLPIVENAISANAMRPGDIYPSRKGLSVEIGNTDAEGRLVLADALALASEEAPDLLIDFATLTGAARVALGPDLPALYTGDDALAQEIEAHGRKLGDPVWRLPLWEPYESLLDGKASDLVNVSSGPHAGSITAALFLRRFVAAPERWAHFDLFAWNASAKPGRPEGAEIQTARLLFDLIEERAARWSAKKN
ncbi:MULTISPECIES: leucyl aminopeptidase family protein [Methylosinus]|uniref:Leucyl aminopeptidase n=1 Tax=Methylosinus trichosporium (strain ATCC 35070 / NCIMB 11131 / UNIQEM 75 / OB3b) TaxID=595536 RepID=A0A2D2D5F0_METT3|nr:MULTISPECIES: leucyl aminopeptidase family protein [Methylosinus]ATQ70250.1 leucyl aminopeptidase [Methylosinus trichosporium OB3b]OBS51460.1 leucyl aminopeptidase [Methylosinus sp. 3S-1]